MIKASQLIKTLETPIRDKWGYILGKAGVLWTEAKQKAAESAANPNEMIVKYGSKWIGHMVADCSGLVKWALVQNGSNCPHGSNSIWRQSLSEKGAIDKNAKIAPGELVFKLRDGTDYYHVGIYIGDNTVVEAQGTRTGVIKSKLSSWGYHGKLKMVDYSDGEQSGSTEPDKKGDDIPMGDYKVTAKNGKYVRIRKGPSKSSNVAYEVPVGSDVKVLASSDGWATVEYTVKGYMMTDYLVKK